MITAFILNGPGCRRSMLLDLKLETLSVAVSLGELHRFSSALDSPVLSVFSRIAGSANEPLLLDKSRVST